MIKRVILSAFMVLGLATGAYAAGADGKVKDFAFSFEGPLGKFDQYQLQRGLQVYTDVCSSCHGLKYLYFRNLADEGGPHYNEDQVKAYASNFDVPDDGDEAEPGDTRPAVAADRFPDNSIPGAPDLTLMAKGRAGFHGPVGLGINQIVKGMGGPEYIASILMGYTGKEKEEAGQTFYENTAFPGGWIAMPPPPMYEGEVEYAGDYPNDAKHVSEDVAAFLMWTAEPKMMARKQFGLVAVIFLAVFAVLLYLTNKQLWAPIKRKQH